MPKITKRLVDATAPRSSRQYIWDTEIKGFGLLVLPSGVKSYFYRYRTADGVERRATLGKHGVLTPDEARDKADDMRRMVNKGGDPLAEKRERLRAATVADVLNAYLGSATFAMKADSTRSIDLGRIERHLRPLLGRKLVESLKQADIEHAFAAIRDGKTVVDEKTKKRGRAIVRGGPGTARKAIRLLRAILAWAIRQRLITSNPADGVETGTDGYRDTILTDAEVYGRLFRTLDRMEMERRLRRPVADAIRVIALTGARRGEVAGMKWKHVDLRAGLVTLPPAAHKTGRKTGKPRIIGLPAAAQAIVARQDAGESEDYVFAPSGGEGPLALSHAWRKIRAEADLPEGIGLHGLRHSLASHMAMAGAQASEIMTALGHRDISTSQKYVHWARDARQALAEKAAAMALTGLVGSEVRDGAEVVRLGGRVLGAPDRGRTR